MIRKRSSSGNSNDARSNRVAELAALILQQEQTGRVLADAELTKRYPDYMPELLESVRTARAIREAAKHAKRARQSSCGADGGDAPFAHDLTFLGEALEGYEILERLEHGGQGVVYKAIQKTTRRTVAIKVLLDGPLASDGQRHRFEREINLASRLQHPNIVTLYESGTVRGRQYFAMEFVDGVPIDDYVLLHEPAVEEIVRIHVKVCRAIASAHQQGVIHRDLKPGNILVDLDGEPHVLDFGLAKCLDGDAVGDGHSSITHTGQVAGTLAYLSPEQANGTGDEIDVRSDVYALGLILYQLLTGGFPYSVVGDPLAVRTNIIMQTPNPLRSAAMDSDTGVRTSTGPIGDDLERIVLKTLSKEKIRRYATPDALADDLERYLNGEAVEAKADSGLYILRKALQRYRVHVAIIAAFFVLLVCSSIMVTSLWWQARSHRQRAEAERDNARQTAVLAHATLDEIVNEFENSIRPLPGGAEANERILARADKKFKQLESLVASDVGLEDVAVGLAEKQGDIALAMGRKAEAAQHYRTFLTISRRRAAASDANDASAELKLDVVRALRKMALVSDEAESLSRQAIELGDELLRQSPNDTPPLFELCSVRLSLAQRYYDAGRFPEASREAKTVASSLDDRLNENGDDLRLDDARWGGLLASAKELNGRILIKLGDDGSGLDALEKSLTIRRSIVARTPTNVEQRRALMNACTRLGMAYRDAGDLERSTALLEEAISTGEYLRMMDPTVSAWHRPLFAAYHQLALIRQNAQDLDAAQQYCEAAVDLAESLLTASPQDAERLQLMAFSHIRRGRLLLDCDQTKSALEDFDAALRIRTQLGEAEPTNMAFQSEVASAHDWVATCCDRLHHNSEAYRHYAAAHGIRRSLLAAQPAVGKRERDVILSLTKLATWRLRQNTAEDDAAASALLDEAEPWLKRLQQEGKVTAWEGRYEEWLDKIAQNRQLIALRRTQRDQQAAAPQK